MTSADTPEGDGTAPDNAVPDAPPRKIIHVDMDTFYASVEQRDDPALRGPCLRRALGHVLGRRCPELVFVRPRFEVYKAVSVQIRAVFARYTQVIEPLSLDEAYLDVTENLPGIALATRMAERIRAEIREATGLTASAGVSYNKFLAKLASDRRKPDGLFVITPRM